MSVPQLPKSMLVHSIVYEQYAGRNKYGDHDYEPPVTIENVRFDDATVFSRDATDTKILANAVIFVDAKNSKNVPKRFIEQSKITFKNKTYTLKKVVDCYHPFKNEIHHYELEVI